MASCALGVFWMLVRWMGVVVHVCDIVVVFVCCVEIFVLLLFLLSFFFLLLLVRFLRLR